MLSNANSSSNSTSPDIDFNNSLVSFYFEDNSTFEEFGRFNYSVDLPNTATKQEIIKAEIKKAEEQYIGTGKGIPHILAINLSAYFKAGRASVEEYKNAIEEISDEIAKEILNHMKEGRTQRIKHIINPHGEKDYISNYNVDNTVEVPYIILAQIINKVSHILNESGKENFETRISNRACFSGCPIEDTPEVKQILEEVKNNTYRGMPMVEMAEHGTKQEIPLNFTQFQKEYKGGQTAQPAEEVYGGNGILLANLTPEVKLQKIKGESGTSAYATLLGLIEKQQVIEPIIHTNTPQFGDRSERVQRVIIHRMTPNERERNSSSISQKDSSEKTKTSTQKEVNKETNSPQNSK
jgi:hypothetical protein